MLESTRVVGTIVLDKTGTVTTGRMELIETVPADGVTSADLLRLVGAVEHASEHPIGRAIAAGAVERLGERLPGVEGYTSTQGLGVAGVVVSDTIKPTSAQAVAELKALGLRPVLLTCDNERAARAVAAVGIDEVIAEVLPADKVAVVERLQREGRTVAMVGDGVNDAALPLAALGLLNPLIAGAAMAFSSVFVVSNSLRLRRFQAVTRHPPRRHVSTAAEAVLARRPGMLSVEANPVSQTATVTYDRSRTAVGELRDWVRDCGVHCAGQSVPSHMCDPMLDPGHDHDTDGDGHAEHVGHDGHTGHPGPASPVASPHDAMGARRTRGGVDGRHAPRHAQPVPGRRAAGRTHLAVLPDRPRHARLRRRRPVRDARRHLHPEPVAAGHLLLGLDLLRRRLAGATSADLGHDGAGGRGGRRRLATPSA